MLGRNELEASPGGRIERIGAGGATCGYRGGSACVLDGASLQRARAKILGAGRRFRVRRIEQRAARADSDLDGNALRAEPGLFTTPRQRDSLRWSGHGLGVDHEVGTRRIGFKEVVLLEERSRRIVDPKRVASACARERTRRSEERRVGKECGS